ncbi:MAG: hypothetical protein VX642_15595 [Bdellovibrionota bacterium]|nr:hypothetical protein [Bdellovibrionota bacterium]
MNLDDIKEQFFEQLNAYKERIQDTPAYNQIKERYDDLPPRNQKIVLISGGLLVIYIVLSIPLGSLSEASSKIDKYESTKSTLASLRKVSDQMSAIPNPPSAPASSSLSNSIKSMILSEGIAEDQIASTQSFSEENTGQFKSVPKSAEITGVRVSLKKLNIKQITSLLYKAQRQSRPAKITHLQMNPEGSEAGFFNLNFEIRGFNLNFEEAPKEEAKGSRRSRRRK